MITGFLALCCITTKSLEILIKHATKTNFNTNRTFVAMSFFRRIANTFLAVLLLVATTGVTLNKHYCLGRLQSVAVFVNANPCDTGMEDPMPCCEDTSEELKVDEMTKSSFDFKSTTDLYLIAAITYVLLEDTYSSSYKQVKYYNYDPPIPDQDRQVLHQVFRI